MRRLQNRLGCHGRRGTSTTSLLSIASAETKGTKHGIQSGVESLLRHTLSREEAWHWLWHTLWSSVERGCRHIRKLRRTELVLAEHLDDLFFCELVGHEVAGFVGDVAAAVDASVEMADV